MREIECKACRNKIPEDEISTVIFRGHFCPTCWLPILGFWTVSGKETGGMEKVELKLPVESLIPGIEFEFNMGEFLCTGQVLNFTKNAAPLIGKYTFEMHLGFRIIKKEGK